MNNLEINKLMEYAKKRYAEENLDINNCKVDDKFSFDENIIKIESLINDIKIQERLEKDLENITSDSKEIEKLYSLPINYIEMVVNKFSKGFLLYGETSLGKSYRVKEVLKRLEKKPLDNKGVGDYMFVSGHITPMRFYAKMYECREKLIIFDDVDILTNPIIINMIKAGLNENSGNVVEYHTTKKMDIPSSFVFNGEMIILLNKIPVNNEHIRAITSRIRSYELTFTYEQKIVIIFEMANKGTGSIMSGVSLKERLEIANFLKDNISKATTNFNLRLFLQAVECYKWNKERWKELTLPQIKNDEYLTLILQGCSNDDWEMETGLSVRTMRRYKKELGLIRKYEVRAK